MSDTYELFSCTFKFGKSFLYVIKGVPNLIYLVYGLLFICFFLIDYKYESSHAIEMVIPKVRMLPSLIPNLKCYTLGHLVVKVAEGLRVEDPRLRP